MRKLLTALCLAFSLLTVLPPELGAQARHQLTARYNWVNYVTPKTSDAPFGDIYTAVDGAAYELAYAWRFDRSSLLQIPIKYGRARFLDERDMPGENRDFGSLDVLVQRELLRPWVFVNPTLHAGIGATLQTQSGFTDFNIPLGLGLNFRLSRVISLNAQTQYRFSIKERPGWHHGVGLSFNFGRAVGDRDNDGVTDAVDQCPDQAGPATTQGCPDTDNDGVADRTDKCPTLAGPVEMMGCPDRDGDGLADNDDRCPDKAGPAAMAGCPDTDGDGLSDPDDPCPTAAGPRDKNGCPDRDGDGLIDPEDACPDVAGPANNRGCPDRDRDGIIDPDDACPDKPGDAAHRGCPDTDGDGVYDNEDRCPTSPGPATNRGCPEIRREDQEKINLAIRNVQFESGRATLLTSSFRVLDEVAGVLQRYPDYSVAINGHTDAQGDDKFNHDLSHRRANTCRDYLISRGVSPARLTTQGFGEERPIASNDTPEGRAMNRRVEFELYIK